MERESSDDEEDRQNLIDENERKLPHRSGCQIEDFKSRLSAHRFSFNKRYLFAIFPPLFILLIYFTTDVRNLFTTSISIVKADSPTDRMRESELRALYLLRQQQLSLFSLWNHTAFADSAPIPSNSSNSTFDFSTRQVLLSSADFKSALLKQISLNKEIQQVLLSSHPSGNLSELVDDNGDLNFGAYSFNRCPKVNQNMSQRPTIEWKPRSDKYLFAICLSGQMSNHLICLEKHMFFAALLNRILVIPSSKFDYQYNRVLDIEHINNCLGRKVVVTFEEFTESKKNHLHIDRVICYFSLPLPCYVDDDHVKKLKSLGISMGKLEPAWAEDIKKPKKRTAQDVQAKFSSNDDVIAIGDVFYANVEEEWVMQPGGPLAHKCQTLIEPSRLIMLTAQRFVQTFLGKSFTALHFRRHGFLKFWYAFRWLYFLALISKEHVFIILCLTAWKHGCRNNT